MTQDPTPLATPSKTLSHKPGLGFMGAGHAGQTMMSYLENSGLADIQLIADPSAERRKIALGKATSARSAGGIKQLLDADIQGIVVSTPTVMHAPQIISALEAGKAVFCQAPLAKNAAQVVDIVIQAHRARKLLLVDQPLRYSQAAIKVHEQIRSGQLGNIFAIELMLHRAHGPVQTWYYDPVVSGGGCLLNAGAELLDFALWCLNFPTTQKISCHLYSEGQVLRQRDEKVEDYAIASMDFYGDTHIRLACSWNMHTGQQDMVKATFYGTRGGICLRNIEGSAVDFVIEQYEGGQTSSQTVAGDPWRTGAIRDWTTRLAAGEEINDKAGEYIHLAQLIDRLYAAAAKPD